MALDAGTREILRGGDGGQEDAGPHPGRDHRSPALKDGGIADFEVTEKCSGISLERVLPRTIHAVRPKVLISVPSGITESRSGQYETAPSRRGRKEVYLVAEPMAAAIGVGLRYEDSDRATW